MGRKRGFFAEIQHQNQVAARQREQAARAAAREHAAAVRRQEQARVRAERAHGQAVRSAVAEQKAAEKEAKRLHVEAMEAEVESLNMALAATYEDIDGLLSATLDVDDYVDLEDLRVVAEHPPFPRPDLEQSIPSPEPIQAPPEPQWVEPPPPTGIGAAIGGKKRHEENRTRHWNAYWAEHQAWQAAASQIPGQQLQQAQAHQSAEQARNEALSDVRRVYDEECAAREAEAAETNTALDELIAGLKVGAEGAVQEYVAIVLGNSVYPDGFPVEHDFDFDQDLKELTLRVTIPAPDEIPAIKTYKYAKSADEIASTNLPQKQLKDRYASAVHQVAVRSIHEVFEADREGAIQTMSLHVGTDSIDPAVGQIRHTPLVAVAVDRETFMDFDLTLVVPQATLEHLGAVLSKNPYGLAAIDTSKGVRRG